MDERPIRVLLVEDDEDDYLLTHELLQEIKNGRFEVFWAASIDAALAAIERQPYDMCLIDYRLGLHSGLDLLRRLVAEGLRAPIIMLTGQADREVDMEAMRAGAADYLIKGKIDAHVLERSIRYAIERHRHQEELRHIHAELERLVQQRTEELRKTNEVLREEAEERKRAEEALREADRRKDEFLATLAHELRNPLAPIRNALEIMRRAGNRPEVIEPARAMMERQLEQMVRLIDDFLDLSRITRGIFELRRERIELATALKNAVETSRPLFEQQQHSFTFMPPTEALLLDADLTRLSQVFSNLLNNAAKYTERGGHIWLSAAREGDNAVVRVRDSGIGIPAAMLPRIFEMFTQVDRSLERSQGGLGIGLTIVRRLIEMHGGKVEGHSAGAGRGSEFVVTLPLAEASAGPLANVPLKEQEKPSSEKAHSRVLVVDDNKDAAMSLSTLLRIRGHEVRTAFDGLEALETASAFRPDIILLDIGMPNLNGYDVARRIRLEAWGVGVILIALTGWGQDEDRRLSSEAGFNHHLVKPVDPDLLEERLVLTR